MNVTEPGQPTDETRPVTPYDPSIPGERINLQILFRPYSNELPECLFNAVDFWYFTVDFW